mmetsp:Transcript_39407/g.77535  ORF Transcript_39407/g.77535 Transcript_39407/m.77535 type:complete len:169 (+) Transcript_39407:2-508(+)
MDLQGNFWKMENLELTGGSRGLRFEGSSDHVTLQNLKIHGTQDVGISMNSEGKTYTNILIRRCEIHDTGTGTSEGMYLGCNNDKCQFTNSVVEENYVHDLMSASQGDGIEIKTGSHSNIVRNNVVVDVPYPCILTYDSYDRGDNIIEGNVCWNSGNNGIQISALKVAL